MEPSMEVVSLCLLTLSLTANAFLLPHHRESCGLRLPVKEKSPAGVDNITTYVTARDGTQVLDAAHAGCCVLTFMQALHSYFLSKQLYQWNTSTSCDQPLPVRS